MDELRLHHGGRSRLLTETEAIECLSLNDRPNPKGSLRWLMRMRRIPYVRVARGIYRFHRSDLDAFIEAHRVGSFGE